MIQDQGLDAYNKLLLYYLFLNYNSYLEDNHRKKANIARLNEAVRSLPPYLASRAIIKE